MKYPFCIRNYYNDTDISCRHGYFLAISDWSSPQSYSPPLQNYTCLPYNSFSNGLYLKYTQLRMNYTEQYCPSGTYFKRGGEICYTSFPGSINPFNDSITNPASMINICPQGFSCMAIMQLSSKQSGISQLACPAGSYGIVSGASSEDETCRVCKDGVYCYTAENSTTIGSKACLPGFYCPTGSSSAYENPCPAGLYGNIAGQSSLSLACSKCPSTSYCGENQTTPVNCPAGYACPSYTISNQSYSSDPGYYIAGQSSNNKITQQVTCPKGSYCPAATSNPIACAVCINYEKIIGWIL